MNEMSFPVLGPLGRNEPAFLRGSRGRAVAALTRGLGEGEILLLLTGPAGIGKSVVLSAALATLAGEARVLRPCNPDRAAWGPLDLIRQLVGRQVTPPAGDPATAAEVADLAEIATGGTRTVIAVDDAQTLTDEALELLLLMASPARRAGPPPQLVLAGRGEFWDRPWRGELRLIASLAERVALEPLTEAEARDCIAFRLGRTGNPEAGGSLEDAVSPEALTLVLRHAAGLPGRIDRVLTAALSIGACRGDRLLTGGMVRDAIASLASAPAAPLSVAAFLTPSVPAAPRREDVAPATPDATPPFAPARDGDAITGEPRVAATLPAPAPVPVVETLAASVPAVKSAPVPCPAEIPRPGGSEALSPATPAEEAKTVPFSAGARDRAGAGSRAGRRGTVRAAAMAASVVLVLGSLATLFPEQRARLANGMNGLGPLGRGVPASSMHILPRTLPSDGRSVAALAEDSPAAGAVSTLPGPDPVSAAATPIGTPPINPETNRGETAAKAALPAASPAGTTAPAGDAAVAEAKPPTPLPVVVSPERAIGPGSPGTTVHAMAVPIPAVRNAPPVGEAPAAQRRRQLASAAMPPSFGRKPVPRPGAEPAVSPVPSMPEVPETVRPQTVPAANATTAADPRCRSIVRRVALGEELTNEDRTFLRGGCQTPR